MRLSKKFIPFKYKLSILLFVLVPFVSSFSGVFQYFIMKNSLEDSFEQSKKLTRDRIVNSLYDADYVNYLMEAPLEAEARQVLNEVGKAYEQKGTPYFDLEPFVKGKENLHLYIIDRNNTVVATTDSRDMNLDFSPWPQFIRFLDKVREEKAFISSRVSLSLNNSEMTKYCYLPSSDGEYIFETGTQFNRSRFPMQGVGFDNFGEQVLQDTPSVDNIILYDYAGVSYKKNDMGESMKIAPERMAYFNQAMETMETVEHLETVNGRRAAYYYVPYQIFGAEGANERNVVEIVFNYSILDENLYMNIRIIVVVALVGAVLAASIGFFVARVITRPIEEITEGVRQVSEGNFDHSIQVNSNDEFSLLGTQFSDMTMEIKKLLEERYKNEKYLERMNEEIFNQNEEIINLYMETSALNKEMECLLQINQNSYFETVRALANAIEEKDSYTGGHCERVMEYSMIIAEAMGLSKEQLNDLKFGSILHDIGKIGISEVVLNKEGVLSEREYDQIKLHPIIGHRILENLHFLDKCKRIVSEHHEWVNGKGYPNGIAGDDIDLLARIVCVADAYDAMTTSRPYRKVALSKEKAIEELLAFRGRQFDERVVDVFVECLNNNS